MKPILFIILQYFSRICLAQADNEIQVYASPITDKGATLTELHSNYTIRGIKGLPNPTAVRYFNNTLEVTHGIDGNFELGFYVFSTLTPGGNYHFQGAQIRPRYTVPEKYNWPFGASISVEFGFFRSHSDSTYLWQGEIRPILDKTFDNWYFF